MMDAISSSRSVKTQKSARQAAPAPTSFPLTPPRIRSAAGMAEIPVIDLRLAGSAAEESARLRAACERLGCFRVTGHGVPAGLLAEMKAAVRALFDLPDDAKRRNADVIPGSGYMAPSPTNPLYEAFGLLDAAAPADVDAFCALLDAPPHVRLATPHHSSTYSFPFRAGGSSVQSAVGWVVVT